MGNQLQNKIHQPTETELRKYHLDKNHAGRYSDCKECSDIFYGRAEMKNGTPAEEGEEAVRLEVAHDRGLHTKPYPKVKGCPLCNDVPEDEEEGLKKSMAEPAKGFKNSERMCPKCLYGHMKEIAETAGAYWFKCDSCGEKMSVPKDDLENVIEQAVERGLLTNMAAQKLSTREGFPKPIQIKYIMPGLVEYEYMNNGNGARILVTKNALDKMLADPEKSIVGKPVINEAHRDVSPDDYQNGQADGIVTRAWYEPSDGWYYCEALVWDEDTRQNIQNGYSVSCEYTGTAWGPAGQLNQVTYDKEVTDGRYKHLAVVSGPRYEGAKIMNSTGGKQTMKLLQWLKKDGKDVQNAIEVDPAKVIFTGTDGSEYSIENAVAALEAQEAKKAKTIGDEDMVIVNGKTYKGSDLKNAIAAKVKNADDDDEDDKKKKKDMENAEKDDDEKEKKKDLDNAEDDDEKEKKEKDAKNAVLMNSQHRLGQHIMPNDKCAICDGIAAERLSNAARMREGKLPSPVVPSIGDGLARGKAMFGKTQAQQEAEKAAK